MGSIPVGGAKRDTLRGSVSLLTSPTGSIKSISSCSAYYKISQSIIAARHFAIGEIRVLILAGGAKTAALLPQGGCFALSESN